MINRTSFINYHLHKMSVINTNGCLKGVIFSLVCVLTLITLTQADKGGSELKHSNPAHVTATLQDWFNYKSNYTRNFQTTEEELYRYRVFLKNKRLINMHNQRYKLGNETYFMRVNNFTDWRAREFLQLRIGYTGRSSVPPQADQLPYNVTTLPDKMNWTQIGVVTPAKYQGSCSCSWAFAAASLVESFHKLQGGNDPLQALSPQQLLDCTPHEGGCGGGSAEWALQGVIEKGGLATAKEYPYLGYKDKECRLSKTIPLSTHVKEYKVLPPQDEHRLRAVVALRGPLVVAMHAPEKLQHYGGGVFRDASCRTATMELTHQALLVGYGLDRTIPPPRSYAGVPEEVHARRRFWLIKNSWGAGWGEQGFLKVARDDVDHCGLLHRVVYPVMGGQ